MMLGSDRVFQDLGWMLWSSRDELDDEDVLTYLFIYSAVYQEMFTITVNSDVFIVYSDDCKYINYFDSFV